MPDIPDVSAIAQQVKARIKHIEDQLKQHRNLTEELERLRDALTRLEGVARSRVNTSRRNRRGAARLPRALRAPAPEPASAPRARRSRRARRRAPRAVRTRPRCSTRSRTDR